MSSTLRTLARWIESHGFKTQVTAGYVVVAIPWANSETRETGYKCYHVRTIHEARDALGY